MSYLSSFIQHSLQPARMVASPYSNASVQDSRQSIPPVDSQDQLTRVTRAPTSEQPAAKVARSVSENTGRSEPHLDPDPAPAVQSSAINREVPALARTESAPQLTPAQSQKAASKQTLQSDRSQPPGSEEAQHRPDAEVVNEPARQVHIETASVSEQATAEHHAATQQQPTKAINSAVSVEPAMAQATGSNKASLAISQSAAHTAVTKEAPFADPVSSPESELQKPPALSPRDHPSSTAFATRQQPPATAIFRPHTIQSEQRQQPQTTPLPQVRIGNINVLIEDQAGAKPARKEATSSAGASQNPFGLRGL